MRVVAVSAKKIGPFAPEKIARPFPVDACLPVSVNRAVTFATESVTFSEVDQLSIIETELISISGIMAIETPSHRLGVMQLDIRMLFVQLSLLRIDLHGGMAVTAGIHALCKGRRRDRKLLKGLFGECRVTDS